MVLQRPSLHRAVPTVESGATAFRSTLGSAQSVHLSQVEQDEFMMPLVIRNAEYIALGKRDKNALKAGLGM